MKWVYIVSVEPHSEWIKGLPFEFVNKYEMQNFIEICLSNGYEVSVIKQPKGE